MYPVRNGSSDPVSSFTKLRNCTHSFSYILYFLKRIAVAVNDDRSCLLGNDRDPPVAGTRLAFGPYALMSSIAQRQSS